GAPLPDGLTCLLDALRGLDGTLAKEGPQIRLVRAAAGDGNATALELLGRYRLAGGAAQSRKPGSGIEVAIRVVVILEQRRRDPLSGDHGIGLSAAQCRQKLVPRPRPYIALRAEFQADGAGEIDIEAREHPILVEVVERWKFAVGQEADGEAARTGT